MKALLLAAGKATRLGNLAKTVPKCLLEVQGEPLLGRLISQLQAVGVEEFIINTHHLAHQVETYIKRRHDRGKFKIVFEPELLGTLGTLRENFDFFEDGDAWVAHADNFILGDLAALRAAFESRGEDVWGTLLTFRVGDPWNYGSVVLNSQNMILRFEEKVTKPSSELVSAATMILDSRAMGLVNQLPADKTDLSCHLLPRMVQRMNAVEHPLPIIDIGTPFGLNRARTWSAR